MAKSTLRVKVVAEGLEQSIKRSLSKAGRSSSIDLSKGAKGVEALTQPLGRITGQADEFTKSMDAANARVLAFGASVGVLAAVSTGFKELISATIEVEKSLTEINTILQVNSKQLSAFKDEIFAVARGTASSFETVSTAALELSRQGLNSEEVLGRMNDAIILSRLSGLDAAAAVSGLTAAINSFSASGITSAEVLNKISVAAQNAAVSDRDLIEGLKRAGSVAVSTGVEFDQLLGVIAALQEKTSRGGAVIGNSLKTIFTRIQSAENIRTIENLGVDVTDMNGALLSSLGIITNVASKLKDLPSGERLNIAEGLVGKFQIAPFLALLEDLNGKQVRSVEVAELAANAASEAYKRNLEQNATLSAAIAQTVNDLRELGVALGEIGVLDPLKDILSSVGSKLSGVRDLFPKGDKEGEDAGNTIAVGLVKGLSAVFLGKTGLAVLGLVIGKLTFSLAKFGLSSIKSFLGLNKAALKLAETEGLIVNSLLNNSTLQEKLLGLEGNRVEQGNLMASAIQSQLELLTKVKKMSGEIAVVTNQSPGLKQAQAASRKAAGGYIPNAAEGFNPSGAVASEQQSINRGVGGAKSSDRPVVIPNFKLGGGKKGPMVVNSGEHLIPNFNGGTGTAVFNRDMAKGGLPDNAVKVAANGFVPNFARPDKLIEGRNQFQVNWLKEEAAKRNLPVDSKGFPSNIKDVQSLAKRFATLYPNQQGILPFDKGFVPNFAKSVYHSTSPSNVPSILKTGLKANDQTEGQRKNGDELLGRKNATYWSPFKDIKGLGSYGSTLTTKAPSSSKVFDGQFATEVFMGREDFAEDYKDRTGILGNQKSWRHFGLPEVILPSPVPPTKISQLTGKKLKGKKSFATDGFIPNFENAYEKDPALLNNPYALGKVRNLTPALQKRVNLLYKKNPQTKFIGTGAENIVFQQGGEVIKLPASNNIRRNIGTSKFVKKFNWKAANEQLSGTNLKLPPMTASGVQISQPFAGPVLPDVFSGEKGGTMGFGDSRSKGIVGLIEKTFEQAQLSTKAPDGFNWLEQIGLDTGSDRNFTFVNKLSDEKEETIRDKKTAIPNIFANNRFGLIDPVLYSHKGLPNRPAPAVSKKTGGLPVKNAANGFVPNFVGEQLGKGAFGTFYKLKGDVGVKRFSTDIADDDRVDVEYLASKKLYKLLKSQPHLAAPKIFGTEKRSLQAKRIGKQVVTDKLAALAVGNKGLADNFGEAIEWNVRKLGYPLEDMHGENYTLNTRGAEVVKGLATEYDGTSRFYQTPKPENSDAFSKSMNALKTGGGIATILDPYLVPSKNTTSGVRQQKSDLKLKTNNAADGFIPNFIPVGKIGKSFSNIQSKLDLSAESDGRLSPKDTVSLVGNRFHSREEPKKRGETNDQYESRIIKKLGYRRSDNSLFNGKNSAIDGFKGAGDFLEVKGGKGKRPYSRPDVYSKFLRALPENYSTGNPLDTWTEGRDNFKVNGLLVSPIGMKNAFQQSGGKALDDSVKLRMGKGGKTGRKAADGFIPNFAALKPGSAADISNKLLVDPNSGVNNEEDLKRLHLQGNNIVLGPPYNKSFPKSQFFNPFRRRMEVLEKIAFNVGKKKEDRVKVGSKKAIGGMDRERTIQKQMTAGARTVSIDANKLGGIGGAAVNNGPQDEITQKANFFDHIGVVKELQSLDKNLKFSVAERKIPDDATEEEKLALEKKTNESYQDIVKLTNIKTGPVPTFDKTGNEGRKELSEEINRSITPVIAGLATRIAPKAFRELLPGVLTEIGKVAGSTKGGLVPSQTEGEILESSGKLFLNSVKSLSGQFDSKDQGRPFDFTNKKLNQKGLGLDVKYLDFKRDKKSFAGGKGSLLSKTLSHFTQGKDKGFQQRFLKEWQTQSANAPLVSNAAGGFIPNFIGPLQSAIDRETSAGVPKSQIFVDSSPRLKSSKNPQGLMVANRRDEPLGGFQGINRVAQEGGDPRSAGAANGFIPNFAGQKRDETQLSGYGGLGVDEAHMRADEELKAAKAELAQAFLARAKDLEESIKERKAAEDDFKPKLRKKKRQVDYKPKVKRSELEQQKLNDELSELKREVKANAEALARDTKAVEDLTDTRKEADQRIADQNKERRGQINKATTKRGEEAGKGTKVIRAKAGEVKAPRNTLGMMFGMQALFSMLSGSMKDATSKTAQYTSAVTEGAATMTTGMMAMDGLGQMAEGMGGKLGKVVKKLGAAGGAALAIHAVYKAGVKISNIYNGSTEAASRSVSKLADAAEMAAFTLEDFSKVQQGEMKKKASDLVDHLIKNTLPMKRTGLLGSDQMREQHVALGSVGEDGEFREAMDKLFTRGLASNISVEELTKKFEELVLNDKWGEGGGIGSPAAFDNKDLDAYTDWINSGSSTNRKKFLKLQKDPALVEMATGFEGASLTEQQIEDIMSGKTKSGRELAPFGTTPMLNQLSNVPDDSEATFGRDNKTKKQHLDDTRRFDAVTQLDEALKKEGVGDAQRVKLITEFHKISLDQSKKISEFITSQNNEYKNQLALLDAGSLSRAKNSAFEKKLAGFQLSQLKARGALEKDLTLTIENREYRAGKAAIRDKQRNDDLQKANDLQKKLQTDVEGVVNAIQGLTTDKSIAEVFKSITDSIAGLDGTDLDAARDFLKGAGGDATTLDKLVKQVGDNFKSMGGVAIKPAQMQAFHDVIRQSLTTMLLNKSASEDMLKNSLETLVVTVKINQEKREGLFIEKQISDEFKLRLDDAKKLRDLQIETLNESEIAQKKRIAMLGTTPLYETRMGGLKRQSSLYGEQSGNFDSEAQNNQKRKEDAILLKHSDAIRDDLAKRTTEKFNKLDGKPDKTLLRERLDVISKFSGEELRDPQKTLSRDFEHLSAKGDPIPDWQKVGFTLKEQERKNELVAEEIKNSQQLFTLEQARAAFAQKQRDQKIKESSGPLGQFGGGLIQGGRDTMKAVDDHYYQLGVQLPQTFSDNMASAMDRVILKGENLKDTLLDVAISFLDTFNQQQFKHISNMIVGNVSGVEGSNQKGSGFMGWLQNTIPGWNSGGKVNGGSGVRDDVPAMLTGGEYVINRKAVDSYGSQFFESLNSGKAPKFAQGGMVEGDKGWTISNALKEQQEKDQASAKMWKEYHGGKQGEYFSPGLYGQGAITGERNLMGFATQSYTTGKNDITRGDTSANAAILGLEPESVRLTNFGRNVGTPLQQALQSDKEQAFGLYLQSLERAEQIKEQAKARKKALKAQLIAAGVNIAMMGLGKAIGPKQTTYNGKVVGKARIVPVSEGGGIGEGYDIMGTPLQQGYEDFLSSYDPNAWGSKGGIGNFLKGIGKGTINAGKGIGNILGSTANNLKSVMGFGEGAEYASSGSNAAYSDIGKGKSFSLERMNQIGLGDKFGGNINQNITPYNNPNYGEEGNPFDKHGNYRLATGGLLPSAGGVDTIPAMLSGGEFVMNQASTQRMGASNLEALNSGSGDILTEEKSDELNQKVLDKLDELIQASSGSTGGGINITVNSSGEEKSSGEGQEGQSNLAQKIKDVVVRVIQEEKRLGGSLRRGI